MLFPGVLSWVPLRHWGTRMADGTDGRGLTWCVRSTWPASGAATVSPYEHVFAHIPLRSHFVSTTGVLLSVAVGRKRARTESLMLTRVERRSLHGGCSRIVVIEPILAG